MIGLTSHSEKTEKNLANKVNLSLLFLQKTDIKGLLMSVTLVKNLCNRPSDSSQLTVNDRRKFLCVIGRSLISRQTLFR